MTDVVPLTSRHAGTVMPSRAPAAPAMTLTEVERVCNMIATGGDMVPKCYQGKPGAVYLTLMWARKHEVDELTAIQNVYPIHGRPFVGADLRVQLAVDRGFDVETVRSDEQVCVLRVTDPGGRVKTVAAVMPGAERPEADIVLAIPDEDAKKAMYSTRRSDMVYAAACRVADRRVFKSAAALVDAAQDYEPQPDPLAVLARTPDELADPELADGLAGAAEPWDEPTPGVADALGDEVTGDELAADIVPTTWAEVDMDTAAGRGAALLNYAKAKGLTSPKVSTLKQAAEIAKHAGLTVPSTLVQLCDPTNDQLYQAVVDWIENRDGAQ